ncbi:hypothetical protein QUA_0990 [Clostridioides difficile P49]|nr:hypothetical protein QUA_0990 [Clostridioides difficile P49]
MVIQTKIIISKRYSILNRYTKLIFVNRKQLKDILHQIIINNLYGYTDKNNNI